MKCRKHFKHRVEKKNIFKGGADMSLLTMPKSKNKISFNSDADWPAHIPMPTDEDIQFLAEMSKRETGSSFFDSKKRSDKNGLVTSTQ